MSDLISRSKLIDDIRMIDTTHPFDDKEDILEETLSTIDFQPTVEAIPKEKLDEIVERLEEEKSELTSWTEDVAFKIGIEKAIEIVKGVMNERD